LSKKQPGFDFRLFAVFPTKHYCKVNKYGISREIILNVLKFKDKESVKARNS
jgi:hypothetical protein